MRADIAHTGHDCVAQTCFFLVLFDFFSVIGRAFKRKNVNALQVSIRFLERAGFHQRIDPFARAEGEVI